MNEKNRVCSMCGCELHEDEAIDVHGELLCNDCAEQYTTTCDHCGETIWNDDSISDGRLTICNFCYDDHWNLFWRVWRNITARISDVKS